MTNLISRIFVIALALMPGSLAGQQPSAANIENGKRLFEKNGCFECHGHVGQGGAAGARIAPWTVGPEALIAYVRHPAGQMPLYTAKVMSDSDLSDVAAYLKNIPASKSAKDIPLLSDPKSN